MVFLYQYLYFITFYYHIHLMYIIYFIYLAYIIFMLNNHKIMYLINLVIQIIKMDEKKIYLLLLVFFNMFIIFIM